MMISRARAGRGIPNSSPFLVTMPGKRKTSPSIHSRRRPATSEPTISTRLAAGKRLLMSLSVSRAFMIWVPMKPQMTM